MKTPDSDWSKILSLAKASLVSGDETSKKYRQTIILHTASSEDIKLSAAADSAAESVKAECEQIGALSDNPAPTPFR